LRDRLITDYHSPGNFRVIGPMSNMPEFGRAFGCSAPSLMQKPKEEQIIIW
jgi:putative endopeptidase